VSGFPEVRKGKTNSKKIGPVIVLSRKIAGGRERVDLRSQPERKLRQKTLGAAPLFDLISLRKDEKGSICPKFSSPYSMNTIDLIVYH
jgi:hypothetical protein